MQIKYIHLTLTEATVRDFTVKNTISYRAQIGFNTNK